MSSSPTAGVGSSDDPYWCYHCDKRVSVISSPIDSTLTCTDCTHGFVESIHSPSQSPPSSPPPPHARDFNSHFLHVLRILAQAERDHDEDVPPPPPPPDHSLHRDQGDYFRIQVDTGDDDNHHDVDNNTNTTRTRDVLRLRLRDLAANRRNRILDWAEILMGMEDHSINLGLQMGVPDGFTADPEDYLDAAGYEALLRDLAESDARRGPPPASQEAILALENLVIKSIEECVDCAVCKDGVGVGEIGKKLPCGHMYHKECIVPWLESRNSCPVCRYELATDDLEYERERRRTDVGPSSSSRG